MKALSIVLSISLVIVSILFVNLRRQYQVQEDVVLAQEDTILALQQTVEALQQEDIQQLIAHVKRVMHCEVVYERDASPLWIYSVGGSRAEELDRVEVDLHIVGITLDGDRGEIRAIYRIIWRDSSGRMLRGVGLNNPASPAIWTLERQDEAWVIVEVYEPVKS